MISRIFWTILLIGWDVWQFINVHIKYTNQHTDFVLLIGTFWLGFWFIFSCFMLWITWIDLFQKDKTP
jgi:putative Mn2+ efflux pump MntP